MSSLGRVFLRIFVIFILVGVPMVFAQEDEPVAEQTEDVEEKQGKWAIEDRPFSYQNVQVPRETWKAVKDVLSKAGHSKKTVDDFGIIPVSVKVELFSEDHVVLKNSINYQINFVEGGGQVDLFDYVVGKGPFHIRLMPDFDFAMDWHILYISDSPGKKVGGDSWGNGCGRIYDLSKAGDKIVMGHGLRVTGARKHYLHLMAGTYIFFQLVEERFYLGYISLEDTRYPQFKCHQKI